MDESEWAKRFNLATTLEDYQMLFDQQIVVSGRSGLLKYPTLANDQDSLDVIYAALRQTRLRFKKDDQYWKRFNRFVNTTSTPVKLAHYIRYTPKNDLLTYRDFIQIAPNIRVDYLKLMAENRPGSIEKNEDICYQLAILATEEGDTFFLAYYKVKTPHGSTSREALLQYIGGEENVIRFINQHRYDIPVVYLASTFHVRPKTLKHVYEQTKLNTTLVASTLPGRREPGGLLPELVQMTLEKYLPKKS